MKKRFIVSGVVVLLLIIVCLFLIWPRLFPPTLPKTLALLVPPDPLLYVQGSQFKQWVEQLTDRGEYATFLQAELFSQVQQTAWWPEFREEFQAFWNSLIIDPMRIVGAEAALAVYASEVGDVLPPAILIGKMDRVARIAERLLYGYDRLSRQVGITFQEAYLKHSVYQLQTPDMIWPLYYAVIGDLGLIATSLPVLRKTIEQTASHIPPLREQSQPENSTIFRRMLAPDLPDHRIVTGYLDLTRLNAEQYRNPLLHAVTGAQWRAIDPQMPSVAFEIETSHTRLELRTQWVMPNISSARSDTEMFQEEIPWQEMITNTHTFPLVVTGNIQWIIDIIQSWQSNLASWATSLPAEAREVYGERLECRLSEPLRGVLYVLPEIACILDTIHPERSRVFVDKMVQELISNSLPLLLQRQVKRAQEVYREIKISRVALMFQEIVQYATAKHKEGWSYTLLTNHSQAMKHHIDNLYDHVDTTSYLLMPPPAEAEILAALHPVEIARVLKKFSQTPTFTLLFAPQQREAMKHIIPFVVQGLQLRASFSSSLYTGHNSESYASSAKRFVTACSILRLSKKAAIIVGSNNVPAPSLS